MFRIFFLLFAFLFILLIGKYYTRIWKRFFSFFGEQFVRKWKVVIFFFSYFLAFCTMNIFSSLGIFLLHFLVFSLVWDGVSLLLKKYRNHKFFSFLFKSSLIPLCLTLTFFLYGYFNIRNIVETRYEVSTSKISSSLRILFLSDAHYGTVLHRGSLEKLKEDVKEQNIDVLILGGDLVDENTTKEEMNEIFEILGSIPSTYGTYFVYGNHDRQKYIKEKAFSSEELNEAFLKNHITQVVDENISLRDDIVLVGREDKGEKRKNSEDLLKNIDPSKYIILVDHQPISYEENEKLGVDLMLSGHTHAGQIFPAGYFIRLFHMADLWYGKKTLNNMNAFVSSGLAGWGYPIRTEEHSEYVIVDLLKET